MKTWLYLIALISLSGLSAACVPYHHYHRADYANQPGSYYSYRPIGQTYGYRGGYSGYGYNRCDRY